MLDGGLWTVASAGVSAIFVVFILWSLVWKGFALWISAREKSKWWFIPILVINTAGILEIIYIFGFSKWGKELWGKRREKKQKKD